MNENIVAIIGIVWTLMGFFYFGTKMLSGPINSLKPALKPIKLLVLVIVSGPFIWFVGLSYLLLIWPLQAFFKKFPQIPNAFRKFDNWLEM